MKIQQFLNNKKAIKKTLITTSVLTLVFLVFGLIFIGSSTLYISSINWDGEPITLVLKGFTVLDSVSINTVLSNSLFAQILAEGSQLGLLKAGIAFAVILTPIFLIVSTFLGGYYYVKFVNKNSQPQNKTIVNPENNDEKFAQE